MKNEEIVTAATCGSYTVQEVAERFGIETSDVRRLLRASDAVPYRPCDTVDPITPTDHCEAPPAHVDSYTSTTCFACGLPTCANCSRIRQYASYGNQRLCRQCLEEQNRPFW